jgi:hypothetical protein
MITMGQKKDRSLSGQILKRQSIVRFVKIMQIASVMGQDDVWQKRRRQHRLGRHLWSVFVTSGSIMSTFFEDHLERKKYVIVTATTRNKKLDS